MFVKPTLTELIPHWQLVTSNFEKPFSFALVYRLAITGIEGLCFVKCRMVSHMCFMTLLPKRSDVLQRFLAKTWLCTTRLKIDCAWTYIVDCNTKPLLDTHSICWGYSLTYYSFFGATNICFIHTKRVWAAGFLLSIDHRGVAIIAVAGEEAEGPGLDEPTGPKRLAFTTQQVARGSIFIACIMHMAQLPWR